MMCITEKEKIPISRAKIIYATSSHVDGIESSDSKSSDEYLKQTRLSFSLH